MNAPSFGKRPAVIVLARNGRSFSSRNPRSFSPESAMKHGTILAGYFLNEALRLFQSGSVDQRLEKAERLLEWLHRRDTDTVTLVEIYRFGINCVRTAKAARDIMGILQDHGWVIPMQEGAEFEGTQRKEAWKVVKQ